MIDMNEWKEDKLGDVLEIKYGKDHKKLPDGKTPCYGSGGIMRYVTEQLYDKESILIPRKGSLNNIYYINEPFWTVDTLFWSKIDTTKVFPKFLFYQLTEIDFTRLNVGSAVPSLTVQVLNELKINLPDLSTQKSIAEILTSLDDKIDLLHRQNKTLEAMAETLFREWFVENAEEDWEKGVLGDILTVKGGTTPSTKNPDFWNGGIHWTTPKDLSKNSPLYLMDTLRKISKAGLKKISSGLLPKGTLLMSSRAPVGYLAFSVNSIAINQGYIAILDDKGFSKNYIYLWLKKNMRYVRSYANGSTFQEISKTVFKSLDVVKSPKSLRDKFEAIISVKFNQIERNIYQIQTLEKLRDTLLPKLMSGEIKVVENE